MKTESSETQFCEYYQFNVIFTIKVVANFLNRFLIVYFSFKSRTEL